MNNDTKPRDPGCLCHLEEGDSPCPVHGDEAEQEQYCGHGVRVSLWKTCLRCCGLDR